jgi:hypothetical protein
MTAGGVRLTDELFTARTPCGVRPRDRDTGAAADSANGLDPAFALRRHNGARSGYGLMNQRCQQFSGGPQSSRTPGTTFIHVVFLLDLGLVRGSRAARTTRQQVTTHDPAILRGGMGAKSRAAALARLQPQPGRPPLLVVATVPYAGEGFDCPAVGARRGSQRVQTSPDPTRRSQILLAGEGLPVRLSPTMTDTPECPDERGHWFKYSTAHAIFRRVRLI